MTSNKTKANTDEPINEKVNQLAAQTVVDTGEFLTTNQGVRINDDQNSLLAGERGPSLLEDFILREKITHFDHERIPERIVHARGSAAHGFFQVYESMAKFTKAAFLQDPAEKTPVFVRFSTVAGFRGSTDLARDARGFAVKFYTKEGNYDLVGNNIPVFFIQDAMKFPDLVHSVKPEQDHGMPQASAAHDTFWDFISLMPESMHMVMWAMSDRAIPRSYRMMEGFGVHTFRFVNAKGESHFVKFHWKPLLGVHAVAFDEAQLISGRDPDFHRRDLWDAIKAGAFPEYELGVQIVPEADEHKFGFDLLDPTKLIPEELVPVQRIGKLTLNRNPDNFHAETEQVAFHPGHVVPGIDFTNDPLLQGRLFSYTDTQLIRLGGPNFHEIPINRPLAPLHNNQREGFMRQTINKGKASYHPNSLGGGCPFQAKMAEGGFSSYPERIDSHKVRTRSSSFLDHFSQATLFYNSQSEDEKRHIVGALRFELGKLETEAIRERMVGLLTQVDLTLAAKVAEGLGMEAPSGPMRPMNHSVPADADPKAYESVKKPLLVEKSDALSMANTPKDSIKSRQIAFLVADGVNAVAVQTMRQALEAENAVVKIVAPKLGMVKMGGKEQEIKADQSFLTAASVLFDAVYVPDGTGDALRTNPNAVRFVSEAFRHCKPIAGDGQGAALVRLAMEQLANKKKGSETMPDAGVILNEGMNASDSSFMDRFLKAIANHRFWEREVALGI